MNTTFFCKLLNDPFSDPSLFVRFKREKKAFLFDAGDISSLSIREYLKISHLFVTHMHIDHFIGFDQLLRCLLSRENPLHVYGPEGIIHAIEGKLHGYTWNVIKEYPLMIEVFEINNNNKSHSSFYATEGFTRIDRASEKSDPIIYSEAGFLVEASIFDHSIPVLGFNLKEGFHININKAVLTKRGLPVGPWLTEFKNAIRNETIDKTFKIEGRVFHMDELNDLALITKGQKIAYITDISPEEKNIEIAIELAENSDILFIEAFFLDKDRNRAIKRNHLTARLAGLIAKEAGVKNLELIHISPKYITMKEEIIEEAMKEFT